MANFENLKTQIQAVIRDNGNNEITGVILQQALIAMISSLGNGYLFKGTAAPTDNPGTPDQNVVYLTATAGTYTNFGELTVGAGKLTILAYNGTWIKFEIADLTVPSSKEGVISQTQTWTNFTDYTMSNIVRGPIPKSSIDLFGAAGAVFNEATGYFELNGLTDLSYEEMLVVYRLPRTNFQYGGLSRLYANQLGRTNFAILAHAFYGSLDSGNAQSLCLNNQYMEAVALHIDDTSGRGGAMRIDNLSYAFYYCRRLKRIIGEIYCSLTPSLQDFSNTFGYCSALEEVRLLRLAKNISFADSPKLSKDSILCMINNEAAQSKISIVLNSTVYYMAVDDADIQNALLSHQNIELVKP